MLTIEQLKAMPANTVFATGMIENSPEGFFVTRENIGKLIRWVAVRRGYWDWSIYYHWDTWSIEQIKSNGDTICNKEIIKRLVPCNDEAFKMYNF